MSGNGSLTEGAQVGVGKCGFTRRRVIALVVIALLGMGLVIPSRWVESRRCRYPRVPRPAI